MLPILSKITEISKILEKEIHKSIIDFKIFLRLNIEVDIYVKSPDARNIEIILSDHIKDFKINLNIYTEIEVENDPFLQHIFLNNEGKINYGLKFRFNSLLNSGESTTDTTGLPPIVTFYSYKGGMGRTTTLASFASYYAMHYKKRIIMIDCDLEAPGFNNFFDLTSERLEKGSGFVEYLINIQAAYAKPELDEYVLEVDKEFCGDGSILVMPAGNLSTNTINEDNDSTTHLQHYLEALSRIDIANGQSFSNHFKNLIGEITRKYRPDLVIIDSRTGFNDIFGLTAFDLSDLVIGFFGSSEQTLPGLHYFIENTIKIDKRFEALLVNSILPLGDRKTFKNFEKTVEDIIARKIQDIEQVPSFQSYPVTRYPLLEKLGTDAESRENFVQIILEKEFGDYNQLFEAIVGKLDALASNSYHEQEFGDSVIESLASDENYKFDKSEAFVKTKHNLPPASAAKFKRSLLEELSKNFPEPYADDIVFDEEFVDKNFYFRPKIYNVFNSDKFLIIGGKGTGKTSLYQGLRNDFFVESLKEKAEKRGENYITTGAINLQQDKYKNRLFVINTHFEIDNIINYDRYFQRFWLVYVWNILMIDIRDGKYLSNSEFSKNTVPDILDDTFTENRFKSIIEDDNQIGIIEDELIKIDSLLVKEDKYLLVLFDQLDFVCKPIFWDKVIAPLVNYWRTNRFNRIFPKIFIRTDLFNKLGNITNKQQLRNQSIDLEWIQEEIYAFFFKWVLSSSSGQFHNLIKQFYKDYPSARIEEIQKISDRHHIPTDPKYLEPYVTSFFGKFADRNGSTKFGTSYDWFYNNLKNADETISLRPFLDLIKEAIQKYLRAYPPDHSSKPILPAKYFADPAIRRKAVLRHFDDLADEEGNKDLRVVYDHIDKLAPSHPLKKIYMRKREFDTLLSEIIETSISTIENRDVDKLKELLIVNGIVTEVAVTGAYKNYRFAFLYKYFLGLK